MCAMRSKGWKSLIWRYFVVSNIMVMPLKSPQACLLVLARRERQRDRIHITVFVVIALFIISACFSSLTVPNL